MRRVAALLLLCTLALVAACNDDQPALPPAPETKAKLTRFEFTLDNVRYAISMPEQAGMREPLDTKSATFDARKTQRLQKIMVLAAVQDRQVAPPDRTRRLRNGSVLNFHRTDAAGGGSGGGMATIEGELEVGLHKLFLYCSDQSEWSVYPDWCVEYLETLEIVPAPSGGG